MRRYPYPSSRWLAAGVLAVMTSLAQSAEPVLEIGEQKYRATAMAYSPDGKILAVSIESFELKLLDASTGKLIRDLPGNSMSSKRVCWSADGRSIFGIDGNDWFEWDVATGAKKRTVRCDMTNTSPHCFAVSPNGKILAAAGQSVMKLWDTANGKALGEYRPHPEHRITSMAFSHDGRFIVSGGSDDKAQITMAATGAPTASFACERDVTWAEFSPDGKTVFVADENFLLHQFDVASGKDSPAPKLRGGETTQLTVSPDGKLVACAGNAQVRLWSRADSAWRVLNITNTAREVSAVAFSPDGKRIATGGTNRGILIWNVSDIPPAK